MENPIILIVDDDPKNIKLLKGMLFEKKYLVIEALNGEEALNLVDIIKPY